VQNVDTPIDVGDHHAAPARQIARGAALIGSRDFTVDGLFARVGAGYLSLRSNRGCLFGATAIVE
jgi:hypothetical protein